jgi:general secretion pathway protein E/type IV pilus assembly protein PilB
VSRPPSDGDRDAEGLPRLNTRNLQIEESVLRQVPVRAVARFRILPVAVNGATLRLATDHERTAGEIAELNVLMDRPIDWVLCEAAELTQLVSHFYGLGLDAYLRWMDQSSGEGSGALNGEPPGIRAFIDEILREAMAIQASDIHLEPTKDDLTARFRIDGVLHDIPLPRGVGAFRKAVASSLKVMANLDLADRRLPQDGRFEKRMDGGQLDIRVSVLPTRYGETLALRLLNRSDTFLGLHELGLPEGQRQQLDRLIQRPHGLVLFTGPTGSGKTTSQYAVLDEANNRERKIITLEDPVEYQIPGITQLQVQPGIGFTFAQGFRSVLRHDPDIILVGEIRDDETAGIAVSAALTGHLVMSTLHTNDSVSAATRLIDMGIEPYLVASSLEGVISQRLVRLLCPECRQARALEPGMREEGYPLMPPLTAEARIWEAQGCPACRFTGYHGRVALFEILEVSDGLRSLVAKRSSSPRLYQAALEQGMIPLRAAGWQQVLRGRTTLGELLRTTADISPGRAGSAAIAP